MKTFKVSEENLVMALKNLIDELDADSLADLAQHAMGGEIYPPNKKDTYLVKTDESYNGALDKYQE